MANSYKCLDIGPDMVFTDDRDEVIGILEGGIWDCIICPQMFGMNTGYYGLFMSNSPKKRTKEEAEKWLSEIEASGGRAFRNEPFDPCNLQGKLEGIPFPNQI